MIISLGRLTGGGGLNWWGELTEKILFFNRFVEFLLQIRVLMASLFFYIGKSWNFLEIRVKISKFRVYSEVILNLDILLVSTNLNRL